MAVLRYSGVRRRTSMSAYTIRAMTRQELDLAVDWAAAEGWNPGLHDADCFHAADPDGFLVGLLDEQPVAVISVVRYGAVFGFLGFYIVHPSFRGRGYGMRIWQAGMNRLAGRVVGLDGVVDQQPNYRKSGFELAHNNVRFEGRGRGAPVDDPGVTLLSDIPFERVTDYDRRFFPADRSVFLQAWITRPDVVALGHLSGANLNGYAVLRPCRNGYKIGPLFADTPDLAERLYQAVTVRIPAHEPVYLDVPQVNGAARDLAKRHGMTAVFETARMYKGPAPDLSLNHTYGVTSFELG